MKSKRQARAVFADETPTLDIFKPYLKALHNTDRYLILFGGAGSGKSYFVAQKIIIRMLEEENHKVLVIRKVAKTLRNSVYDLIKGIIYKIGFDDEFKFTINPLEIIHNKTQNKIIFQGLDDPEKLKSIADITMIWIEEATELEKNEFDQIDLRLRGETTNYKQILISFNPVDENHWIRHRFFPSAPETMIIKTTYKDNPKRGEEYDRVLEEMRLHNPSYFQVYGLGDWGTLVEGDIFPAKFYSEWDTIPDDTRSVLWVDPNLSQKTMGDTTAITELGYSPRTDTFYVIKGICESFSDSDLLLNKVLNIKEESIYCQVLGFDGNVTQESTWSNNVKNWCRQYERPYPAIEYKRYNVDELMKNVNLTWVRERIKFPPMFKERIENKRYISQVFSFQGKKAKHPDDAPDSLICAFELLHERKITLKSGTFKQPVIESPYSF